MDYNNVNIRLKRIYASINQKNKYGLEVLAGMHNETIKEPDGGFQVIFSFGNDIDTLNQIQNVISNLANLKDILKDCMEEQGKDKQIIENEIDKSIALQLILDLSNQEKHGYPLEKIRRSKKDPLIKNIRTAISPSDKPDNVRYSGPGGSAAYNVMISIRADIVDSTDQHLFTLDELLNQAIKDWENIIKIFGIIT